MCARSAGEAAAAATQGQSGRLGLERDPQLAERLYVRAIELGDARAAVDLDPDEPLAGERAQRSAARTVWRATP
jgi:hypothetical protein